MNWLLGLLIATSFAPTEIPPSPFDLNFQTPTYSVSDEQRILARYNFVDANHAVPDNLLKSALLYFDFNQAKIPNQNVIGIIDMSEHSSVARWYFVDMKTGVVTQRHVSHGIGSDPTKKKYPHGTGYARKFGNVENSLMTSLGFFLAAESYSGSHGLSVRLDGLSETNSNARKRAIVVHSAEYVIEENKLQGRSDGCFAVAPSERDTVMNLIAGGSLIYAGLSKGW